MESPRIRAHLIEATEFPEYSRANQVMAVPKVVFNFGAHSYEGAYPEPMALKELQKALGPG